MNEQKWLTSTDPQAMLLGIGTPGSWVGQRPSERKLRLFACACCRRLWHRLPDAGHRRAIEVAERFADVLASPTELAEARTAVVQTITYAAVLAKSYAVSWAVVRTAGLDNSWDTWVKIAPDAVWHHRARAAEQRDQADLLRDILGNPFRPTTADCSGLERVAGAVARSIYAEHRFGDLPILADALEEAGCTDLGLLTHCRGPGPHARGCWALDRILRKD